MRAFLSNPRVVNGRPGPIVWGDADRGDHIVDRDALSPRRRREWSALLHRALGTIQRRIDGQDGEPIRKTLTRAELRARRSDRDIDQARSHLILRSGASGPATTILEAEDDEAEEEDEENEDERSWAGELEEVEQDDEEFELDDVPATSRAASLMRTWQTIGQMGGLRLGLKAARSSRTPRRSRIASAPEPTPFQNPRARLRAITTLIDAGQPRGSDAVELLVEATSYLTGGVTALRQYAEARGCDPKDARAAERAVLA
jgi:hypothetical protein